MSRWPCIVVLLSTHPMNKMNQHRMYPAHKNLSVLTWSSPSTQWRLPTTQLLPREGKCSWSCFRKKKTSLTMFIVKGIHHRTQKHKSFFMFVQIYGWQWSSWLYTIHVATLNLSKQNGAETEPHYHNLEFSRGGNSPFLDWILHFFGAVCSLGQVDSFYCP